ncbi:MAG: 23S rRNA (adenine(2503)-C(2))-methyltransferase RlmN [Clostridiales bacterium]|jgi:23S rRNA (adenine2503-C2)-methyltransferase|nr:23S rRNA (adenine(2503)-C(2))-methyltransferase RlmN [Clostridiales bacterium]
MDTDLRSLTMEELKLFLKSLPQGRPEFSRTTAPADGGPSSRPTDKPPLACSSGSLLEFRAAQIFEWLHKHCAGSFDDMTNLPKVLREELKKVASIPKIKTSKKLQSSNKDAIKYLFETDKATIIESVWMKYSYGSAVCVSTQAGCRMGCVFCASSASFSGSLPAGDICAQVYAIQRDLNERVSRVVFMGCGEPLDNYDNFLAALRCLNSKQGQNIGQRNMTVSTCGLVPKIYALAGEGLQVTLAVSLHAPNDQLRQRLMPIARKYTVTEVLRACKYYGDKTKRRVTIEYALIKDVNDSRECARELAGKLRGAMFHVNLIPFNRVNVERGSTIAKDFLPADKESAENFTHILRNSGIPATLRRGLGEDVDAACGQLRSY